VKNHAKILKPALLAAAMAAGYGCRMLARYDIGGQLGGFVRALIYFGLFTGWTVRVRRSIPQRPARGYLASAGGLMLIWIFVRTIKYEFPVPPVAARACWYLYYLPMLFIPLMGLLTALSLGRPGHTAPDGADWALCAVTTVLLALVLTNDFHQLVFGFPPGQTLWEFSDDAYTYRPLYFAVIGWEGLCGLGAVVLMAAKSRLPYTKQYFWLPLIPWGIMLAYTAVYYTGARWLRFWLGDLPITQSVLFIAAFEACIRCGMIQSNTHYVQLFSASGGCGAQIADADFAVCYASQEAAPVAPGQIRSALQKPLALGGGKMLHAMPIRGGYAVWTQDQSALLAMEEQLQELKEELQERNALLRTEYAREQKRRKLAEQNRLFDLLQQVTQKQLDRIALLMQAYEKAEKNTPQSRAILAQIAVLCGYIKRRRHLALMADRHAAVPSQELQLALGESLRMLGWVGVANSLFVDLPPRLGGQQAAALYDFFEAVIEAGMGGLHALDVRAVRRGNRLRMAVTAVCDRPLMGLQAQYPTGVFETDEGEQTCLLELAEGDFA